MAKGWKKYQKMLAKDGVEVRVYDEEPAVEQTIGGRLLTINDPRLGQRLWVVVFNSPVRTKQPQQWTDFDTALEALIQWNPYSLYRKHSSFLCSHDRCRTGTGRYCSTDVFCTAIWSFCSTWIASKESCRHNIR